MVENTVEIHQFSSQDKKFRFHNLRDKCYLGQSLPRHLLTKIKFNGE